MLRAILFGLIVLVAGAAQSSELYSARVAGWTTGAYANDKTGEFSHCSASVPYKSGISLYFFIGPDFRWFMGFSNPTWRLTEGASYPVTYQIDAGQPISAQAEVLDTNFVGVNLLNSDALFEAFRRGHILTVRAAGDEFFFHLANSSKALAATLACASRYAARRSTNPFLATVPPVEKTTTFTDPALKAEALALTANLLANAGVSGFQLIGDVPEDMSFFHAMWVAPHLVGGMTVVPQGDTDDMQAAVTASVAKNCKGRFASAKLPVSSASTSVKTICEGADGKTATASFVFLRRQKGGAYMLATMDAESGVADEHASPAEMASGRIIDASVKVLGR